MGTVEGGVSYYGQVSHKLLRSILIAITRILAIQIWQFGTGSPYVYMRVGNFGEFQFGGCNIDRQTTKFSGSYMA